MRLERNKRENNELEQIIFLIWVFLIYVSSCFYFALLHGFVTKLKHTFFKYPHFSNTHTLLKNAAPYQWVKVKRCMPENWWQAACKEAPGCCCTTATSTCTTWKNFCILCSTLTTSMMLSGWLFTLFLELI